MQARLFVETQYSPKFWFSITKLKLDNYFPQALQFTEIC